MSVAGRLLHYQESNELNDGNKAAVLDTALNYLPPSIANKQNIR